MGSIIGWSCTDCGAGESFYCGSGKFQIDKSEVEELSAKGEFGPAMKKLFEGGIPDRWSVFHENDYYRCPGCGDIIHGDRFVIDDSSSNWLVFHQDPEACPSCGEELSFWVDKQPLSERDLEQRCESVAKNGCPKCGSKHVALELGNWD